MEADVNITAPELGIGSRGDGSFGKGYSRDWKREGDARRNRVTSHKFELCVSWVVGKLILVGWGSVGTAWNVVGLRAPV